MRYFLLFTVALLLVSIVACGSPLPPPESDDPKSPLTVIDQAGRAVTVEAPVERIVSGFYISSSTVIALGAADRLVGIEARAEARPIYALAAPELLELPNVGTARDFNLEACLELRPDLVILPYRLRDVADILEEMGVPAILVNPESLTEMRDMITLIGQAIGAYDAAASLNSWLENAIADIQFRTVVLSSWPPVVYITGTGSWLTTSSSDMFQARLIELAGGVNASSDIDGRGRVDVSYEQLLAMNPDVIIIPPEADFDIEDILTDPPLAGLAAVRNRRVYKMPAAFEAWDSPVPSSILGAKWLLNVLHENILSHQELQQAAADFYKEFFNIDIDVTLIR